VTKRVAAKATVSAATECLSAFMAPLFSFGRERSSRQGFRPPRKYCTEKHKARLAGSKASR
jgi:hypothetical protein